MNKQILKALADEVLKVLEERYAGKLLLAPMFFRILKTIAYEAIEAGLFDLLRETPQYQQALFEMKNHEALMQAQNLTTPKE